MNEGSTIAEMGIDCHQSERIDVEGKDLQGVEENEVGVVNSKEERWQMLLA